MRFYQMVLNFVSSHFHCIRPSLGATRVLLVLLWLELPSVAPLSLTSGVLRPFLFEVDVILEYDISTFSLTNTRFSQYEKHE